MSRRYRLAAIVTLAALLVGAAPAAAAPAGFWSLLDSLAPLDWIRHLWAETNPWDRPAPAGHGIAPPGAPRQVWAEDGSAMDPLGRTAPMPSNEGSPIDPLGQQ